MERRYITMTTNELSRIEVFTGSFGIRNALNLKGVTQFLTSDNTCYVELRRSGRAVFQIISVLNTPP